MVSRRVAALVVAGGLLAGCGGQDTSTEGTQMMQERTVEAFESSDPSVASLARSDETRPRPIATPFTDRWFVIQLEARHRLQVVAVTREGEPRGVVLSGHPERWAEVVEGVTVADEETAAQVADAYSAALRPTTGGARLLDSIDDLDLPSGAADQAQELQREHGADVADRSVTAVDGGWRTQRWSTEDRDLVRHVLTVAPDGTVEDERTVVEQDLPLPIPL